MLFWEDEPFSVRAGLPAGPGVPLRVLRVEIRIDLVRLGLGFRRRDRRRPRRQARQSRIAQIASPEWIAAMIRMRPWHFGGVSHALSHLKNSERLGLDGEEP